MKKTILFSLFLLSGFAFQSQAQMITTIAGGGTAGLGDNGPALSCELLQPIGIAVDAAGNKYVGDRDNHRIRKISTSGIITTVAGTGSAGFSGDGGAATAAMINKPYGVAVDNSGNVFFADGANNRIRKIGVDGIINTVVGTGTFGYSGDNGPATSAELGAPVCIAFDNGGNMYITDAGNFCVRKVDQYGVITLFAGRGSGVGDGGPATSAQLVMPYSIAVDNSGNVYVGEDTKSRVRKINTSGIISTVAGTGLAGYNGDNIMATVASLRGALGVAVDWMGNLYISDANNHRIRKVSMTGMISTIAGTGTAGFTGEGGNAASAEVSTPTNICFDGAGGLLVADFGNSRIRRISNVVSTQNISGQYACKLDVFPNPSEGRFNVFIASEFNERLQMRIGTITGEQVAEYSIYTNTPLSVDLRVSSGLYWMTVANDHIHWSEKVVIVTGR